MILRLISSAITGVLIFSSISFTASAYTSAEYEKFLSSQEYFKTLTASEKKQVEAEYKVDSIYFIPTSTKPLLSDYYITRPEQYGAYAVQKTFIYDPEHLLKRSDDIKDTRRYPATILPEIRTKGTYYPRGYQPVSQAKYIYTNPPILTKDRVKTPQTFYNNFTSYPTYNSRW